MYHKLKLYTIYLFLLNICFTSCTKKSEEVLPYTPTNLTITASVKGELSLTWIDNSTNEVGFRIERRTGDGSFEIVAQTDKDLTTFKDSQLSPNTIYYYRVYSYNNMGKSLTYTNTAQSQTLANFSIGMSYGGGVIFYIDNTGSHGLIAATKDLVTTFWYYLDDIQTGATDVSIGSGKANTIMIVNKHGSGDYAAYLCSTANIDNFQDWYLPSLNELKEMYNKRQYFPAFANKLYWSSSESTSYYGRASGVNLISGTVVLNADKPVFAIVRPVRSF